MERLRKIIYQLSENEYKKIEQDLIKNKSENFLFLFRAYREGNIKDSKCKHELKCTENAYYVLKSRLYDKVQENIMAKNVKKIKGKSIESANSAFVNYLYEYPRETSMAILQKVEQQFLKENSPIDLMQLYSLYKKIYFHSNKYYQYSQAYNKQVAYAIAYEKAEDILFNFNKALSSYFFSRSATDKEILQVLLQEIKNNYSLNQSPKIEIIKNIIIIQIQLFTDINLVHEDSVIDLLNTCDDILESSFDDAELQWYNKPLVYLKFEYYLKIGENKKALKKHDIINKDIKLWLLYSNVCFASRFFHSKINLMINLNRMDEIKNDEVDALSIDPYDFNTELYMTFYKCIVKYYHNEYKQATVLLEEMLSKVNFKNYFHLEVKLRLSLAFFYLKYKRDVNIDDIINPLNKRLKKFKNYDNAKIFIEILNLIYYEEPLGRKLKLNELADKFMNQNQNQNNFKILQFLEPEIKIMSSLN